MEIKWTDPAQEDLQQIEIYGLKEWPDSAARFVLNVITHAEILRDNPGLGRVGRRKGTREFVFGRHPFILVYRIRGKLRSFVYFILHANGLNPDEPLLTNPGRHELTASPGCG